MAYDFKGKRALVTGAGRGIGRKIAKCLAESGAEVFALSRTLEELESLRNEVQGATIHPVVADLENWEATRAAVEAAGPVDLLVNNAAIAIIGTFLETTKESLERTYAININAIVNVSQVAVKGMIERGTGGSIVIISSAASDVALHGHTAYCSSKGAQNSLAKVMALELGPHKIRVNAIQPTVVLTKMGRRYWCEEFPEKAKPLLARHPLGKFAEEQDIADGAMFLLSDKSSMVTGTTLRIDGGLTSD